MKKIKILFLAANPKQTNQLALDEEIREITQKIRMSEGRDLDVISGWAVRPDDLLQYLNEHKPQIVHFSGHGSSEGELILVDNNGKAKPVSSEALKALFTILKDNIQVVILNACYSRIQAEAINEVIDFVIGMNKAIGDNAAITFAASFYRALGFNRTVQEAFDQAKTALLLEGIPEQNTPHLFIRNGVSADRRLSKNISISNTDATASVTDEALSYLSDLFAMWTISGFLAEDSNEHKYTLSAFYSLLIANGLENPLDTMFDWISKAKRRASEAFGMPKTMFGYLEFDTSGPYELLEVEESYFRLWKRAVEMQESSNMIRVRLSLAASVGEERQKELISTWNKRMR